METVTTLSFVIIFGTISLKRIESWNRERERERDEWETRKMGTRGQIWMEKPSKIKPRSFVKVIEIGSKVLLNFKIFPISYFKAKNGGLSCC